MEYESHIYTNEQMDIKVLHLEHNNDNYTHKHQKKFNW